MEAGDDLLIAGAYGFAEAARYIGAPPATVRAWFLGASTGAGRFERVLKLDDPDERMLSFRNLVELHVLNAIRRQHRVTLYRVRNALAVLATAWGTDHPLANRDIHTDGYDLFARVAGLLINVSRPDEQLYLQEILEAALSRVERSLTGSPSRLFPFPSTAIGRNEPRPVEIDPATQFGRPCVSGTGIPTEVLYDRHAAGENTAALAADYELTLDQVAAAIEYEEYVWPRRMAAA